VLARWRGAGHGAEAPIELPGYLQGAADELGTALLGLARSDEGIDELSQLAQEPGGEAVLSWCVANAWRRDVGFARIFEAVV
jgi:hypothetical protein